MGGVYRFQAWVVSDFRYGLSAVSHQLEPVVVKRNGWWFLTNTTCGITWSELWANPLFEDAKYPIPDAPAHQVLAFLLCQHNLTQSQLADAIDIKQSNLSAVLNQKRQLTIRQIKALATYFGISPMCFL